ncbi:hypothetical protein M5K25_022034 [Dendrobium thyrsiflorum]|uniref:Uncharacterized protein n=1 Tax=Dendrobium thyrsiflorum TaxID=117978 RepID=A0ABD0U5K8_DENTH
MYHGGLTEVWRYLQVWLSVGSSEELRVSGGGLAELWASRGGQAELRASGGGRRNSCVRWWSGETPASGGGPVKRRASGGGPAERRASSGGPAEHCASGGGPAERQASRSGPTERRASGGGPAELQTSGGGPAEHRESGGGPAERRATGGGPAERRATGGGPAVVWQNAGSGRGGAKRQERFMISLLNSVFLGSLDLSRRAARFDYKLVMFGDCLDIYPKILGHSYVISQDNIKLFMGRRARPSEHQHIQLFRLPNPKLCGAGARKAYYRKEIMKVPTQSADINSSSFNKTLGILDNRLTSSIRLSWIELTSTTITSSPTMDDEEDEEDAVSEVKIGITWDNLFKEDNRLEMIEEVIPAISKP